jgi:hypothetical protein
MHAEIIEFLGDLYFVVDAKRDTLGLRAVPESRIVDDYL